MNSLFNMYIDDQDYKKSTDGKFSIFKAFQNTIGEQAVYNTHYDIKKGAIYYRGIGSSSLPPKIIDVYEKDNTIHLVVKTYEGMTGTADVAPCHQVIKYSNDNRIHKNAKIVLV